MRHPSGFVCNGYEIHGELIVYGELIEYDKVKAKSIEATLNRLHRSGTRVFGAVLTKLSQRAASYEYGYGYPSDSSFLKNVQEEAIYNIKSLKAPR